MTRGVVLMVRLGLVECLQRFEGGGDGRVVYASRVQLRDVALGDAALDTVAGVMVETPSGGAVTLFTGNSPGARERAGFLADMLTNFQTFYSWMKAYLDIRQNGFTITYRPDFVEIVHELRGHIHAARQAA